MGILYTLILKTHVQVHIGGKIYILSLCFEFNFLKPYCTSFDLYPTTLISLYFKFVFSIQFFKIKLYNQVFLQMIHRNENTLYIFNKFMYINWK